MSAAERIVAAVNSASGASGSHENALRAVSVEDLATVLHASVGEHSAAVLCSGIAAAPGAAAGKLCLSVDAVLEAVDSGEQAVFVAMETGPADEPGMRYSSGIVTARGGLASHAAIYSRGLGLPAVCGVEALAVEGHKIQVGELVVAEGETITVDGAKGEVLLGGLEVAQAEGPAEVETLLGWADTVRAGKVGVRANADNGVEAGVARELGADGIGLCRTEHMFLGERLPVVRRVLMASDDNERRDALAELEAVQRLDFVEVLAAMDGLPVAVRLLDAPLHEFLEQSHEQNPMLGLRGVRLALVTEGLYRSQVRALLQAVADRRSAGGRPVVEIMVPLVSLAAELRVCRDWITEEVETSGESGVAVGTMIETPRAALRAGELARHADFFSFGTNDLTQMTFGFSRDDVGSAVIGPYVAQGLLARSPFESLDTDGVGELVSLGVSRGRQVNPGLKCGICGEHGGDPASIAFVVDAGLDYVSCSPPRLAMARLAAAQAVLGP